MRKKNIKIEKRYEKIFEELECKKDDSTMDDKRITEDEFDNSNIKCPECFTHMINAPFPNLGGAGVGQTISGSTKRPSWGTEKVCPKCGYVEEPAPTQER